MRATPPVILLLEANRNDRASLGTLMEIKGMTVRLAPSGGAAVLAAVRGEVDAVVLDGSQADMTGAEIVAEIRQWNNTTAIIFTSDPGAGGGEVIEQNWRTRVVPLPPTGFRNEMAIIDALEAASPPVRRWFERKRKAAPALILQDDDATARITASMLKQLGFEVHMTHTGEDAVEFAHTYLHSVMIIDDAVPDMSGYEVIKKIRKRDVETPIFWVSSSAYMFGDKALAAGADELIQLPCDWKAVARRVHARIASGRVVAVP
jgi:DNA-binding response OmpR family regulator